MKNLVEIRASRFGMGLFARKNIMAGSIICPIELKRELNFASTTFLNDRESHALQVDHDKYFLCEVPFLYVNHSCNPNCGVYNGTDLISLVPVKKGEELFWDYSTSMLERHWTMKCLCGEKKCRKIITDFDLLPHNLQLKYMELNLAFPFISQFLNQQLGKTG